MDLTPAELEDRMHEYAMEASKLSKQDSDAQIAFDLLKDWEKEKFAEVVDKQIGSSMTEKQHKARLSDEWKEWKREFRQARADKTKHNKAHTNANRLWEHYRSLLSNTSRMAKMGI